MSKALATKKVAAVLLGLGMVLAFAGAASAQTTTTTTTTSSSLSALQAQVQALLAQIAALQGTGTATTGSGACFTFTQDEWMGLSGGQVMWVQEFLNGHGFTVAASGAGSPGNETSYFGGLTKAAVMKFQSSEGITPVSGYWGPLSRAKANAICAGSTTTTTTTTGTGTTVGNGLGITVTAGVQPANSLAPVLANRVPFTTFTLTNNSGAAVTVNGIDVQRTGLANNAVFAGVELINPNGIQVGIARSFNSNNQTEIGSPFTLNAGQSETFTVAGNMETTAQGYGGQVASVSVVGIDTTVPVAGTLPITGAQQTVNETLTIGTASVQRSSFDPDSSRSEPIGTTGLIYSGVRITAGSAENEKLYSITWNQTGSVGSGDISNLVTIVNGTSYPMTVDSSGKYFTASFPGGITINEGQSVDAYVQGDLTGTDASGRSVEFDIYRSSDIYMVGQTYGYGITPTASNQGTYSSTSNSTSGFQQSSNPFFFGATLSVTAGTLSTIGNAGSVGAQNIAINTPNQPLGGFTTNFTGEPVTVQSVTFTVASTTSGGTGYLQNVSIVGSNGTVIAGPVNESSSGTLVFNSEVTFPVGAMTYTIEGTVPSGSTNGTTYVLSTNPLNQWLNPQGEVSGSNVSLPNTTITLSTMTVEGPNLVISAASTPASTNIAPGSSNFVLANINLNASQSGENVSLTSIPIVINASSTASTVTSGGLAQLAGYLTNCQLYNGSTALNNTSIGNTGWSTVAGTGAANTGILYANFIFQNPLVIPKGTVVTLSLECNVSTSITSTDYFSAGVNGSSSTYEPSPTGVQSGNTLYSAQTSPSGTSLTVQTSASGTMTPGTATLAANVDSSSPAYAPAAGGTSGVIATAFNLQPTSDSVNLQNIGLALNSSSASSSDVLSATIWSGSTQVGSVIFTGAPVSFNGGLYYLATTSVSSLNLPQNVQTVLTVKANLSNVGSGQSGTDGHIVKISLADAQGTGLSSGTQVNSGTAVGTVAGVGLFRSFPTLAVVSSNSGSLVAASNQTLYEFSVTPSSGGQGISLDQVGVNIATSSASTANGTTTVTNLTLYGYTDSGFSQPLSNSTNGGEVGLYNGGNGVGTLTNEISLNKLSSSVASLQLSAGQTYYFKVEGTVTQVAGTSGTNGYVQTYLAGDATQLTTYPYMDSAATATSTNNFIWSPNATSSPALLTTDDWTTGYGLPGLPSTGMQATTLSN